MKIRNAFIALAACAALAVSGFACTKQQEQTAQTVTTSANAVCEVVFTAVDPTLAPLCTTAEAVAQAIEALTAQASATLTNDAGTPVAAAVVLVKPTNAQVYQYLAAHGAKTVAK
jgi:uncharacterized protein (UPF0210 family)